jgi:hypothetical protein
MDEDLLFISAKSDAGGARWAIKEMSILFFDRGATGRSDIHRRRNLSETINVDL